MLEQLQRKRLLWEKGQHDIKHSKAKITSVHKKCFEQHILFLFCRRPLYTFYSVFVEDHNDYGNKKILECFSYHKLRSAWLSFLKWLDIDFENGFSCPDCSGDGPEIIICDGTSLSFQRRMWSWKNTEMPTKTSPKKKSGYV